MIPPTPTLTPDGTPIPLNFDELSLWQMAPESVGLWNQFNEYTPTLQWIFVALLLGFFIWAIAIKIKSLSEEEA